MEVPRDQGTEWRPQYYFLLELGLEISFLQLEFICKEPTISWTPTVRPAHETERPGDPSSGSLPNRPQKMPGWMPSVGTTFSKCLAHKKLCK